ncbi:CII family transcriptional regulator [Enterobacter sp.]|uniref:CII family transcriptional regulator n=1 Tax=Enterobacter sp. TaxID=42895 RepID=UPI00296F75AA|nr:CII family transcriptional regulator [Enterobacter sp.]
MEHSTSRNKCEARRIETWLLNQMALRGVTNIAKALGMDKSSITRWKESMVPKMALLLAELEYGVVDEDVARVSAVIASAVTNNRAGGEVITHYKEQVVLLKATNDELRKENNELRERREKDLQRISHLESDIRIIKSSLRMLIAITQAGRDEEFRGQVSAMLTKLEEDRDET